MVQGYRRLLVPLAAGVRRPMDHYVFHVIWPWLCHQLGADLPSVSLLSGNRLDFGGPVSLSVSLQLCRQSRIPLIGSCCLGAGERCERDAGGE